MQLKLTFIAENEHESAAFDTLSRLLVMAGCNAILSRRKDDMLFISVMANAAPPHVMDLAFSIAETDRLAAERKRSAIAEKADIALREVAEAERGSLSREG